MCQSVSTYGTQTPFELGRRFLIDFRTTTAETPPSGTTLSRTHLFDVRSALGSCRRQLLISAIYSKRCSRESIEPKVAYLTHSGGRYQKYFCCGRAKNRRASSNGVYTVSVTRGTFSAAMQQFRARYFQKLDFASALCAKGASACSSPSQVLLVSRVHRRCGSWIRNGVEQVRARHKVTIYT